MSASERAIAEQAARRQCWQDAMGEDARACTARLTAIVECGPDAMYSSRDDRITSWNQGAEALYGYSAAEIVGRSIEILYPPGGDELLEISSALERGEPIASHRTTRRRKDGSLVQVWLSLRPILDDKRRLYGIAAVGRDITDTDLLLEELRASEGRYRSIVENAQEGIALIGLDSTFTFANRRMGELLGRAVGDLIGVNAFTLINLASATAVPGRLEEGPGGEAGLYQVTSLRPDGSMTWLLVSTTPQFAPDGGYSGSLCMISDLSGLRRAEQELAYQAWHDGLTGLPNRALLADRIEHALDRSAGGIPTLAILSCDLDGFKDVNDSFGHHIGDQVLRVVAERLVAAVRPGDTVARIGGDEFIVLGENVADPAAALALADRLRASVARPIQAAGSEVVVTCSVGVALAPAADAAALLRNADAAKDRAKLGGRNRIELFDESLRDVSSSRLGLLAALRHAVARGQLVLYFQPVIALDGESVAGAEALVRWQHPERGLLLPDGFIGLAEDRGLIVDIGIWVLREACRQAAAWAHAGPGGRAFDMAVNVSARQLAPAAGLVECVAEVLRDSGVDPTTLVIEITETALMGDAEAALRILTHLKALGVRLAIDDFGTGYSSLVYLKRFPVGLLKIDRSFIQGLGRDPDDTAIVASVIGLARAVGIDSVAEGVETAEQLVALQELGCAFGQGYLWSKPVPAADFERTFLRRACPRVG